MWNFSKSSYHDSPHNLLCRCRCDSIQLLYATDIFSLEAKMPGHSEGWYIRLSRKMHCLCTLVARLSRDWEALRMAQGIIEISENLLICLTFSLANMLDPLLNPFLYNLVLLILGMPGEKARAWVSSYKRLDESNLTFTKDYTHSSVPDAVPYLHITTRPLNKFQGRHKCLAYSQDIPTMQGPKKYKF